MSDTAKKPEVVTDSLGRKIALRKMNVVEQMRMYRAIGPDQANNMPYAQMVECVFLVSAIDGQPAMLPFNERQIDAAAERLGDEGMAAVMQWRINELNRITSEAEAAAAESGENVQRADPFEKSEPSPSMAP